MLSIYFEQKSNQDRKEIEDKQWEQDHTDYQDDYLRENSGYKYAE